VTLINSTVWQQKTTLREQFRSSRPFPHIVVDGFVDDGFCRRLMTEFPEFDPGRARSELGTIGRKAAYANLHSLGPAYAEFDSLMQSQEFLEWVSEVTGIPRLLYDPEYIGGGAHLNLDGQDLDPHVDFNYHPSRRWHRRLNLILFLNPEWDEAWGGALQLHRDPHLPPAEDELRTVLPLANRCVIFETSERSWHGFKRIRLPPERSGLARRSIAVYFYTEERPRHETAPEHGTVYVPRPLPERFRAGYTLTGDDIEELQIATARRDSQIEHLYRRELEFSRVAGSVAFRLARMLTWPARVLLRRK
jgi:Rps23 Pro-64 3,4-dihydroxylase Tpa1-like proline 4-hydroxylase